MPEFRDLKSLKKYIQDQINDCLVNEIAEDIRDQELTLIDSMVYDSYSPSMYERRGEEKGGLKYPGNIKARLESDGILIVENKTPFSQMPTSQNQGDELIGLIEYGSGGYKNYRYEYYQKNGDSPYAKPRPVISETRDAIKDIVADDICDALINRGLKVKRIR